MEQIKAPNSYTNIKSGYTHSLSFQHRQGAMRVIGYIEQCILEAKNSLSSKELALPRKYERLVQEQLRGNIAVDKVRNLGLDQKKLLDGKGWTPAPSAQYQCRCFDYDNMGPTLTFSLQSQV